MFNMVRELFKILLALFVLIIAGTLGYVGAEGWSLFDAFYMSVITITTTGFGEVHPLSTSGRVVTIFLLCAGVGVFTYSVGQVMSYLAHIDFADRRRVKMQQKIAKMSNHTIICGFGRMGEVICQRLSAEGAPFVVIEKREALLAILREKGYFHVIGDGAQDSSLLKAGVEEAKILISVIDNDADALYITIAARSFNEKLQIITRANETAVQSRMYRAGADKVILPFVMSGIKVAESVLHPGVDDVLDLTGHGDKAENVIHVADMTVREGAGVVGAKVKDLGKNFQDLIFVGVRQKKGDFLFKPGGEYQLKAGDCLITMGNRESYETAKIHFDFESEPSPKAS